MRTDGRGAWTAHGQLVRRRGRPSSGRRPRTEGWYLALGDSLSVGVQRMRQRRADHVRVRRHHQTQKAPNLELKKPAARPPRPDRHAEGPSDCRASTASGCSRPTLSRSSPRRGSVKLVTSTSAPTTSNSRQHRDGTIRLRQTRSATSARTCQDPGLSGGGAERPYRGANLQPVPRRRLAGRLVRRQSNQLVAACNGPRLHHRCSMPVADVAAFDTANLAQRRLFRPWCPRTS